MYDVTDDGSSKSLGSFCRKGNSVIPPVLTSSSSKMRVLFQSDADTNGNGFFAEYTSGDFMKILLNFNLQRERKIYLYYMFYDIYTYVYNIYIYIYI